MSVKSKSSSEIIQTVGLEIQVTNISERRHVKESLPLGRHIIPAHRRRRVIKINMFIFIESVGAQPIKDRLYEKHEVDFFFESSVSPIIKKQIRHTYQAL